MDKASYFEKLVGTLSRIASHSYYPGKEDAVEQCLEEVEEIRLSGQITAEQSATLRDLLLGEEPFCLVEGALRERSRWSETAMPTKNCHRLPRRRKSCRFHGGRPPRALGTRRRPRRDRSPWRRVLRVHLRPTRLGWLASRRSSESRRPATGVLAGLFRYLPHR